jgi:hypothetical protein
MLIVPLPPFLLDFMLAISITLRADPDTALLIGNLLRLPDRAAARSAAQAGAEHRDPASSRPRP